MVENGSLNRPVPLVNYINCDPLSDHSKSKAPNTKVQQPCHTLQMPLAKINYSCQERRISVFLHYRTEKALRAIIPVLWLEANLNEFPSLLAKIKDGQIYAHTPPG